MRSVESQMKDVAVAVVKTQRSLADTQNYNCAKQGQYFDYSGACRDCEELCTNGDRTMCKLKCPLEYMEMYKLKALQGQLYIIYAVCGVVLTCVILYLLYRLMKHYEKETKKKTDVEKGKTASSHSSLDSKASNAPLLETESQSVTAELRNSNKDDNFAYPRQEISGLRRSCDGQRYPPNNHCPSEDASNETSTKAQHCA